MELLTFGRYLAGLAVGAGVFFLAIPYGLYVLAKAAADPFPLQAQIRVGIAIAFAVVGLVFVLWSNAALLFRGEGGPTDLFNIAITPCTKHLVITGPYRLTRNPMVFGALCCYVAVALWADSLAAFSMVVALFVAARFYLRATEEERLRRDFGLEFEKYRARVGMIVPWPLHHAGHGKRAA